jgi:hypothetical protein
MAGVEQDGLRTDERDLATWWLARLEPVRPASRIVVRTLLVADTGLLLVTGVLLGVFMQRPAGFILGGSCWALAGALVILMRVASRAAARGGRPPVEIRRPVHHH